MAALGGGSWSPGVVEGADPCSLGAFRFAPVAPPPVVWVVVGGVAPEGRPWNTGPPTAAVSAGELELGSASLPRVWVPPLGFCLLQVLPSECQFLGCEDEGATRSRPQGGWMDLGARV